MRIRTRVMMRMRVVRSGSQDRQRWFNQSVAHLATTPLNHPAPFCTHSVAHCSAEKFVLLGAVRSVPTANIQDGQWEKQMRKEGVSGEDLGTWAAIKKNKVIWKVLNNLREVPR